MRILTRSETRDLVRLEDCIEGVEAAFRLHSAGGALGARRVHVSALDGGAFHITAGGLTSSATAGTVAVKVNGRFPPAAPGGGQRVTGAILLMDAANGTPLALLDSAVVTSMRTAAVTAVVVRHLARKDATSALLVGAGKQAPGQVEALAASGVARLEVFDLVRENAERVARHAEGLGVEAAATDDVGAAARRSDVVVTVTPAVAPILQAGDVAPGSLVVALGADGPGKQELDPAILAQAKVVVDIYEQAAESGELQHALAAGLMRREDVYAELAEVVAGEKEGRSTQDETFVFDATGTALQDVVGATLLLEAARERGIGTEVELDV